MITSGAKVVHGTSCDLSNLGIFKQLENGKYDWGDYKVKHAGLRSYGTVRALPNKGQVKKPLGILTHKNANAETSSSYAWLTCNLKAYKTMYLVKCDWDGSVSIGKEEDALYSPDDPNFALPDCSFSAIRSVIYR